MERIIINLEGTGFCPLSSEAIRRYCEYSGMEPSTIRYLWNTSSVVGGLRRDPILIKIIEELGARANADEYTCLVVVDVPDIYRGVVKAYRCGEEVEFQWKEDHLRKLIRLGNEDDIVNYVRGRLV